MTNPGYSSLIGKIDCHCLMGFEIPWEYWTHPNGETHPYLNFRENLQPDFDRWLAHGVNVGVLLKGLAGPPPEGSRRIKNGDDTGEVFRACSEFVRDDHSGHLDRP
jgi:hypothetical protein